MADSIDSARSDRPESGPTIHRNAAGILIPRIRAAAARANTSTTSLHRIVTVAVFGSFVSTRRSIIGDLDIAVRTERIPERDPDEFNRCYPSPPDLPPMHRAIWPWWEVAINLNIAPPIHLNHWNFITKHQLAHRVIFNG